MSESILGNGKIENGINGKPDLIPATTALANFVVTSTEDLLTSGLSKKLKTLLLDYLGVSASAGYSADSSPKFLAGIKEFAGAATGNCTVLTKGSTFPRHYAALLNGTWCHTYDFDDTHAKAVLHPGSSLISATLAEAEASNISGSKLLLALAIGYEVACRVGIALGLGAYDRGFHNTATAGLYGSIAAVCSLRNASSQVVNDAFGLAASKAAGTMQFLENGSWNKRLHPGFAAHDALLCVTLAEAGVIGASLPIEGKYGLLHNYSENPNPAALTEGLGQDWTFIDTACKPFPACRMTHGQLEMVGRLREEYREKGLPVKIVVTLHPHCYPIVGQPTPNKIQPQCIVDAQFSSYFQVAAAWYYGNRLGWAIYEKISDVKVQNLCKRISCETDDSFRTLQSKIQVVFEDGTTVKHEVVSPLGESDRPFEWESGVKDKFLGLTEPVYGKSRAEKIASTVYGVETVSTPALMKLLA